ATDKLRIDIQEETYLRPRKFLLVHPDSNQSVLISFHRLVHETAEAKVESMVEFFSRPYVKPGERYLFIERLIGDINRFREMRNKYLQDGTIKADEHGPLLEKLKNDLHHALTSKISKKDILQRIQ